MTINKDPVFVNALDMNTKRVEAIMKEKKASYSVTLTPEKIKESMQYIDIPEKDFNLSKFLDSLMDEYLEIKRKENQKGAKVASR